MKYQLIITSVNIITKNCRRISIVVKGVDMASNQSQSSILLFKFQRTIGTMELIRIQYFEPIAEQHQKCPLHVIVSKSTCYNFRAIFNFTLKDQGHPTTILGKYVFGRRFAIQNFRNICCKISCLPASPRIFEHLKNGIIAHF